jgi:hypothetical protein
MAKMNKFLEELKVLKMKSNNFNVKTYYYFGGIILLCLYYIPFLILGEGSNLIIHDNLDINMCGFINLKRMYAPYCQDGQFLQIMNGLPDYMLPSKWSITGLLFLLFHPFIAYLSNDFLSRIIGFLGMALLLDYCVFHKELKYRNSVIFSIALTFALLACYTSLYGLSILGQPLVIYAFWNLYQAKVKWWHYLMIFVFAFWSSPLYSGIFIGALLFSIWVWGLVKDKRLRLPFFAGMVLLGVGYLIEEHSLIFSMFDKSAVTPHRVEFQLEPFSALSQIKSVLQNGALITQYHTGQFWTVFIILPLAYIICFSRKMTRFVWQLTGGIVCILLIQFLHPYIILWFGEKTTLIKDFNWSRFNWLLPMLWLILFAVILERLLENASKRRFFISIALMIGLCFSVISHNRELCWNAGRIAGFKPRNPSFCDFYDTKLFSHIKKHIGQPEETYRVVSLGLFPSIAAYNGFFCLDSYQVLYPLAYKHAFREIIAPELDKNIELRKYFDHWGSRCYLFSDELRSNYMWSKKQDKKVSHLDINTEKLKQLSQKETYIISAVEIVNHEALGMALENIFEGNYWKIHLYKVNREI